MLALLFHKIVYLQYQVTTNESNRNQCSAYAGPLNAKSSAVAAPMSMMCMQRLCHTNNARWKKQCLAVCHCQTQLRRTHSTNRKAHLNYILFQECLRQYIMRVSHGSCSSCSRCSVCWEYDCTWIISKDVRSLVFIPY